MISEEQKFELLYDKIMNDVSDTEQRIRDTIEKSGVEVNTTDLYNIFQKEIIDRDVQFTGTIGLSVINEGKEYTVTKYNLETGILSITRNERTEKINIK